MCCDIDGAVLVVGLVGMGIEGGVGELVGLRVVHGHEDLAGLDGVGDEGCGGDSISGGGDGDLLVG